MMVFVKKVNHQVNNYIVSQTMLLTCFPVYIWDFKQYPVPVSYKTHSFMPNLVDFFGMYYMKEILQRVPTFCLSMDKMNFGSYRIENRLLKWLGNCPSL